MRQITTYSEAMQHIGMCNRDLAMITTTLTTEGIIEEATSSVIAKHLGDMEKCMVLISNHVEGLMQVAKEGGQDGETG